MHIGTILSSAWHSVTGVSLVLCEKEEVAEAGSKRAEQCVLGSTQASSCGC